MLAVTAWWNSRSRRARSSLSRRASACRSRSARWSRTAYWWRRDRRAARTTLSRDRTRDRALHEGHVHRLAERRLAVLLPPRGPGRRAGSPTRPAGPGASPRGGPPGRPRPPPRSAVPRPRPRRSPGKVRPGPCRRRSPAPPRPGRRGVLSAVPGRGHQDEDALVRSGHCRRCHRVTPSRRLVPCRGASPSSLRTAAPRS